MHFRPPNIHYKPATNFGVLETESDPLCGVTPNYLCPLPQERDGVTPNYLCPLPQDRDGAHTVR